MPIFINGLSLSEVKLKVKIHPMNKSLWVHTCIFTHSHLYVYRHLEIQIHMNTHTYIHMCAHLKASFKAYGTFKDYLVILIKTLLFLQYRLCLKLQHTWCCGTICMAGTADWSPVLLCLQCDCNIIKLWLADGSVGRCE